MTANAMRIGQDKSIRPALTPVSAVAATLTRGLQAVTALDAEMLRISGLDLFALGFDRRRIVLHHLDRRERRAVALLLDLRMDGMLSGEIDEQLLAFAREQITLEQARRVGVGGARQHPVRAYDERR